MILFHTFCNGLQSNVDPSQIITECPRHKTQLLRCPVPRKHQHLETWFHNYHFITQPKKCLGLECNSVLRTCLAWWGSGYNPQIHTHTNNTVESGVHPYINSTNVHWPRSPQQALSWAQGTEQNRLVPTFMNWQLSVYMFGSKGEALTILTNTINAKACLCSAEKNMQKCMRG